MADFKAIKMIYFPHSAYVPLRLEIPESLELVESLKPSGLLIAPFKIISIKIQNLSVKIMNH